MSYFNILRNIERGQIDHVYLLLGTESYFIQNIIQRLIQTLIDDNRENLATYDLTEVPIEGVIEDAMTFPFFGERKLIIAKEAQFLLSRPNKLPFKHQINALERYLNEPSPSTVLVIIAPYESIDGRKKITRQLKKQAQVVECQPIEQKDLHSWIKALAKNEQIQIDEEAVELLAANLSTNLFIIQNELLKCAQYVGKGKLITKDVVFKLLTHLPVNTSLQLVDAVIEQNLKRAIYIYRDLKLTGEKPISIIALLAFQYRIILQVKLLKKQGYHDYQIRQKINAHPYVIKLASERERRFTLEQLRNIIHYLTETDAKIKRGLMLEDLALEQLLYTLIRHAS